MIISLTPKLQASRLLFLASPVFSPEFLVEAAFLSILDFISPEVFLKLPGRNLKNLLMNKMVKTKTEVIQLQSRIFQLDRGWSSGWHDLPEHQIPPTEPSQISYVWTILDLDQPF